MTHVPPRTGKFLVLLAAALVAASFSITTTQAEVQSGQIMVLAVQGDVTYSIGNTWQALKPSTLLGRGATIKTGPDATADLILQYNGTVLRLIANSTLSIEKLGKENDGEEIITETSLNLLAGSLVGSQRKLAPPSVFTVKIPGGSVTIRGTEYLVHADGSVTCLSGSVDVIYNLPNNGGSIKVLVPAQYTFDATTGQVRPSTAADLTGYIADINTLQFNAQVFKTGGATVVVKPEAVLSPSKQHGNNGVGNGLDPQPPGNPPINDGPGTGPGHPGNKGGSGGKGGGSHG